MNLSGIMTRWFRGSSELPAGEDLQPSSDTRLPLRVGIGVLLVGFGGFLLWAAFAPLDEGVPTQGTVTVDTKRKTVQHLSGGIVEKVLVREAQLVNAGDGLIKLNDAAAKANYEGARQRYLGVKAMEARLLAERAGQDKVIFHADLTAERGDPLIMQQILTQEQLFISRRQALRSELDAIDESIKAQEELAGDYADQEASRKRQLGFIGEELEGVRGLVAEGYVPRTKLWELERMSAESSSMISDIQGNRARALRSASKQTHHKTQRQQEFRKDVDSQLADVQRELVADDEKYRAAKDDLERMLIRSPADGAVVGIATQTVGGVIQAGARIMDIVPRDEALILETRIPPHLVDRLRAGQLADIRFSGFAHSPQLVIEGKLISVSADLLTDPANNTSYYLGRVRVTEKGIKELGSRQLQPGMPAEVILKTGERSLLTYLVYPLVRRVALGMKEE